jgi:hypothetical protein
LTTEAKVEVDRAVLTFSEIEKSRLP